MRVSDEEEQDVKLESAARRVKKALSKHQPEDDFVLTPLKSALTEQDVWVFRCKTKGRNESVVCKIAAATEEGQIQIARQFRRLSTVNEKMAGSGFAAPQALVHFPRYSAFLMEDVKGSSLREEVQLFDNSEDSVPYLRKAGKWLAAFQDMSKRPAAFDPTPHMNWLKGKVKNRLASGVVDTEAFGTQMARLGPLAEQAAGRASFRCVTHGDFHAANVLFRRNGDVFGIDFENTKEDEMLSDVVTLMFDLVLRWPVAAMPESDQLRAALGPFLRGSGAFECAPEVARFYQTFAALNKWAGVPLGKVQTPDHQERLSRLAMLAEQDFLTRP